MNTFSQMKYPLILLVKNISQTYFVFSDGLLSTAAPHVLGKYKLVRTAMGSKDVIEYRKSSVCHEISLLRISDGIGKWRWLIGSEDIILEVSSSGNDTRAPRSGWSFRLPSTSLEVDSSVVVLPGDGMSFFSERIMVGVTLLEFRLFL